MKIDKYKPIGFSENRKPTPRMLFDELILTAFKLKAEGNEVAYQKLKSELTPPPDPNNVWGDALDLTGGKPPIPEEKISILYVTYCLSKKS